MGRKSTKENKSIYQLLREEAGYTREQAAEKIDARHPAKMGARAVT